MLRKKMISVGFPLTPHETNVKLSLKKIMQQKTEMEIITENI